MIERYDPEERIRNALAQSWSSSGLQEALQVIAEGIGDVAGFTIATVNVLHDTGEFEVIAVAGSDECRESLGGKFNPAHTVLAELERSIDWGRFKFVPPDQQANLMPHSWTPDVVYPDSPDAWHVDNLLMAPLYGEDGEMVGMLQVDVPFDGLSPSEDRIAILNSYAVQAERALVRALERHKLADQVRMAEAARAVIRRASTQLSAHGVLEQCGEALMEGFGVDGLWLHVFDLALTNSSLVTDAFGRGVDVPPELVTIAERAARLCWDQQRIALISRSRSTAAILPADDRDHVLAFIQSIGVDSMMFVPLGAGQRCVGNLVLTRGGTSREWTDAEAKTALDVGHDLGQALLNAHLYERDQELVHKLSELDAYKGQLIATIAHEFKNPITAITGHVEVLGELSREVDFPAAEPSLAAIRRSADRLSKLVDNLMLLERVKEAPDIHAVLDPVDVVDVVNDVTGLLGDLASTQQISLRTTVPPRPTLARVPDDDLTVVLNNLVSNAIKYGSDGGQVRVSVEQTASEIVIGVADDGIGISDADQERLFEEFFRSTNPAATEKPGTGLGLAIVARMVDRMKGSVRVVSKLGEGTTFTIVLPAA